MKRHMRIMSDDKQSLLQQVVQGLNARLVVLQRAAAETHKNSTSAESKAEGKYDTRGLEASYLAEAQAEQVTQLEADIARLKSLELTNNEDEVEAGSIVTVTVDDDDLYYFVLPAGGGIQVPYLDTKITVITPASPIGNALTGKAYGDTVELPNGNLSFITEIE